MNNGLGILFPPRTARINTVELLKDRDFAKRLEERSALVNFRRTEQQNDSVRQASTQKLLQFLECFLNSGCSACDRVAQKADILEPDQLVAPKKRQCLNCLNCLMDLCYRLLRVFDGSIDCLDCKVTSLCRSKLRG